MFVNKNELMTPEAHYSCQLTVQILTENRELQAKTLLLRCFFSVVDKRSRLFYISGVYLFNR